MFRKLRAIPNPKELRLIEKEAEFEEFGDIKSYEVLEKESNNSNEPEFACIEAFVQYLIDDERSSFSVSELQRLNEQTHIAIPTLITKLANYGLALQPRERKISDPRGYTSKSFLYADIK